ncbi:Chloride channel 2 [Micractinium conductrix]|uniref:Chloride channel 2 n=1 Tax=Micractinium conductrix TaxID=554055 RepID=A0A2P6VN73_9CHLO|nr:Chloride channel 2 [Micractinium conductrix]|eukprot:PSC75551.1 Chloride channel 2 [Micractinium conductrix]
MALLHFFGAVWLLTLAGGLIVLGGLGVLTNDSTITPTFPAYRLAWTGWSLEVVGLLVALYALVVGPYRHWKPTVLMFYASVTGFLIPLTNDVFVGKSGLPGSNGSDTRALVTGAGLILAILSGLHDTDEPRAEVSHDGTNDGKDLA